MDKLLKSSLSFLLSILILFVCTSCGDITANEDSDVPPLTYDFYNFHPNMVNETDYSNITISLEKYEYTSDDDYVKIFLKNDTPGKGFYFCSTPFVEKMIDGEWVRLHNAAWHGGKGNNLVTEKWFFAGHENAPEKNAGCTLKLKFKNVSPKMKSGLYRVVVFIPKDENSLQKLYAEFNFT